MCYSVASSSGCSDRYLDDGKSEYSKERAGGGNSFRGFVSNRNLWYKRIYQTGQPVDCGPDLYAGRGGAGTIDLDHPAGKVLSSKAVVSSKPFRT